MNLSQSIMVYISSKRFVISQSNMLDVENLKKGYKNIPLFTLEIAQHDKHCAKDFQIRIFFSSVFPVFNPNNERYRPETTPYLDAFYAVKLQHTCRKISNYDYKVQNIFEFTLNLISSQYYFTYPKNIHSLWPDLEYCFEYCVKNVQIPDFWSIFSCIWTEYGEILHFSIFSPNAGKYGLEKTPYLDTFHAVEFQGTRLLTKKDHAKFYIKNRSSRPEVIFKISVGLEVH